MPEGLALPHSKVALIAEPAGLHTGVGRYAGMLLAGLKETGIEAVQVTPTVPPLPDFSYRWARRLGRDLSAFVRNYPLWSKYPKADIYHLTTQALGLLLLLRRPRGGIVVTVHDIFPYMLRNDAQFGSRHGTDHLFPRLAMAGLKRADHLIAVSEYTKRCVVDQLGIASEKIEVIHNGIDHRRFRPLPVPPGIHDRYQLPKGRRYLIYVGSEDPRKDLVTLVRALAQVRYELPNVELIKAGHSHCEQERQWLIKLATELQVRGAIHFLEDIPDDQLPLLYNLAEVYVTPSPHEGFGFPVLEAMACGTPVVYADAGSLPEIAGNAGIAVTPCNPDTLARALLSLLKEGEKQSTLRTAGHERAARFTWTVTTQRTVAVYRRILRRNSGDRLERSEGDSE